MCFFSLTSYQPSSKQKIMFFDITTAKIFDIVEPLQNSNPVNIDPSSVKWQYQPLPYCMTLYWTFREENIHKQESVSWKYSNIYNKCFH